MINSRTVVSQNMRNEEPALKKALGRQARKENGGSANLLNQTHKKGRRNKIDQMTPVEDLSKNRRKKLDLKIKNG